MKFQLLRRLVLAIVLPLMASPVAGQQLCEGGFAGTYPCSGIDLLAFMDKAEIGEGNMNDIWGWTDPQTRREYALVGRTSGTSFVDMSQPLNPVYLGNLRTQSISSSWRDIKVYQNYAFIVADGANAHGMQVFDLTRLRSISSPPEQFSADAVYRRVQSAHNININEDSGYAYIVGSSECAGGLHMVNIQNPLEPEFVGCFSEDGYTHDVQCVTYAGPDPDYSGREICFGSNTDTVTIIDVTDKSNPEMIFRAGYPGSGYVHQGWLTGDHRYFVQNDEFDEVNGNMNTTTYFWDVTDLDSPQQLTRYVGPHRSIDHNLYIRGNFVFQSNYTSGLRILDIGDIANPVEVAFFDTYPATNSASFNGSWSNYPFFSSGNIPVTGIREGLFILKPSIPLLPANLAEFSASVDDNENVTVSWQTLSESAIASFDVQLQIPGGSFRTLATLQASGTTTDTQYYEAVLAESPEGPQVFRLLVRTEDGDEFYSDTISVFIPVRGTHALLPAFPNPTTTTTRVALVVQNEQRVTVRVYDPSGREIMFVADEVLSPDAQHSFVIDGSNLSAGTYFVRASGEEFDATTPVAILK